MKALGSSDGSLIHLKGAKAILEPRHDVEAAVCVEHDGMLMSSRHVIRLIHKENLSTVLEIILLLCKILMRLMHVLMCFLEPFRYKFWCWIHASCQEWWLSCGWSWLKSRTRQRGSVICCIDPGWTNASEDSGFQTGGNVLLLFLPLSPLLTSPVGRFAVWLLKSEAEVDAVWCSRLRETQSAVSFIFVPVCYTGSGSVA